jgi:hypothetical protein
LQAKEDLGGKEEATQTYFLYVKEPMTKPTKVDKWM